MVAAIVCVSLPIISISCATTRPSTTTLDDLSALSVNPLECTGIVLKKYITIKKEIIHEPSFMQNRFMVVLLFREAEDEKEVTPGLMPGYNNISFVSEVEQPIDMPLIIHQRYRVVEIWRLYPQNDRKICYLWTIGDRGVSMKLMLEDLGGRFLSERQIPLTDLRHFEKRCACPVRD